MLSWVWIAKTEWFNSTTAILFIDDRFLSYLIWPPFQTTGRYIS
jgi:hypothetical protein